MSQSPTPRLPGSATKRGEAPSLSYADLSINRTADLGSADRRLAARLALTLGAGFMVFTVVLVALNYEAAGGMGPAASKIIAVFAAVYLLPAILLIPAARFIRNGSHTAIYFALCGGILAAMGQLLVVIGSAAVAIFLPDSSEAVTQVVIAILFIIASGKLVYHLIRVLMYRGTRGLPAENVQSAGELLVTTSPVRLAVIGAGLTLVLSIATAVWAARAWVLSITFVQPRPGDPELINPTTPRTRDWAGDCYDPKLGLSAADRAVVIAAIKAKDTPSARGLGYSLLSVGELSQIEDLLREGGRSIIAPATPPVQAGAIAVQIIDKRSSGGPEFYIVKIAGATIGLGDREAYVDLSGGRRLLTVKGGQCNGKKMFGYIELGLQHLSRELAFPLTQPQADRLIADFRGTTPTRLEGLRTAEGRIIAVSTESKEYYLTTDGRETLQLPSEVREAELQRVAAHSEPTRLMSINTSVVVALTIAGIVSGGWACMALLLWMYKINDYWRVYALGRIALAGILVVVWMWALIDFNAEQVAFWPPTGFMNPLVLLAITGSGAAAILFGFYVPMKLIRRQGVAVAPPFRAVN